MTEQADVRFSKIRGFISCGFESHRSYQPLLFVVRSGGVVVVGEKARNSIKSLDKGQGAEPMAR